MRVMQPRRRLAQWGAAAALTAGVIASVALLAAALTSGRAESSTPLSETIAEAVDGERFTFVRWQWETSLNRWLGAAGRFLLGEPDCGAREAAELLEAGAALANRRNEQCVELALERAVSRAASALGLAKPLPLFGRQAVVWPPVDIELRAAPRVLAVSPRAEIRLTDSVLLSPRLPRSEFETIERQVEADGEWSAWIGGVGGVATYPAIVTPRANWRGTLQLAAHEWVHHYLIFHALGRAYFASDELRTINETVADIAGDEIGRWAAGGAAGLEPEVEAGGGAATASETLRQLRQDVDALLSEGRIVEAEAQMEAARRELFEQGLPLRRINQAWFAFRGGYATQPGAVSPYGPLLERLRARSPSLAAFMAAVRTIGSPVDADALLTP